jgi:hypothetical protein
MKFMERTAGYSLLDRRTNEDVLQEPKLDPVGKKPTQYKQGRLNHIGRMKTLNTQNNSLNIDLSKDDLEDR